MAKPLDLSIIIPVAPGADPGPAMRAVANDLPRGVTAEIITVAGRHPTRQRNLAAMRAQGRALYFLDHDSLVQPGAVARLLAAISNAVVAGGPNVAAAPKSWFEELAAAVIDSQAGSPGVTDRYHAGGDVRPASERSLILCNLMIDRDAFLAAGGFDPRLYPNEENELMNRLVGGGGRMKLDPAAAVKKPRPGTLWDFLRETFRYGRGRATQIWVNGQFSDTLYVVPVALAIGLIAILASSPALAVLLLKALLVIELLIFLKGWRLPIFFALSVSRLLAYVLGMAWGGATGLANRRVRLIPLRIAFHRYAVAAARPVRLVEEHVFNIGSWSKEVPASA